MENRRSFSDYALCFVSSMALHLHWLMPAVLLFAAHFVFGISLWWAATLVIGWASGCRQTPSLHKENRNPYSASPYQPMAACTAKEARETEV